MENTKMNKSKSYLAFTIGPIYQTFRNARHTREVWGASYLFSYITKGIILKLIDSNIKISAEINYDTQIAPYVDKFILPNISSAELFKKSSSVGLFPDNIIVDAEILNGRNYQDIIKAVISELSQEIANAINKDQIFVEGFLSKYLRIIGRAFSDINNPIIDITPALNCLELQPFFLSEVKENPLEVFLKTINKKHKHGFMNVRGIKPFESLIEIATNQFSTKSFYESLKNKYLWDDDKNDDRDEFEDETSKKKVDSDGEFVKALMTKCNTDFKTYHKYVAIVKADGDKIGTTLKQISDESKIKKFSEKLLAWGIRSKEILEAHKAKPIFIGGDDLLFFSPIVNEKGNVFELIEKLDQAFNAQDWAELNSTIPTLSYGLSITYYKFPLIEAIELADDLLYQAKNKGGNNIAIQFLKHSGSELPFVLDKDKSMPYFKNIMTTMTDLTNDKSFVNSVGYKIRENNKLIEAIHKKGSNRIESLFINVFEEQNIDTKRKPKDKYLKAVRELLLFELGNNPTPEEANKALFSLIRTVKFIKGLDELK